MFTRPGNKKRRRTIFRLSIVLLACLAELNILANHHARSMLNFTAPGGARTGKPESLTLGRKIRVLLAGVALPRPESRRQPSELSPDCRRLSIPSADGVRLGAWYVDRGSRSPLVMLFHGYGEEKTRLLPEAGAFLEQGASVLLVDFRGSGESTRTNTTVGLREAADVAAAVRYAKQSLPHTRLFLYGRSMGAAALLRAIAVEGVRPDAVVIEAVFDTLLNAVRNRFGSMGVPSFPSAELLVFWAGVQTGYNAFAHRPAEYARSVPCPTLVLHGSDDPRARVEEGQRVFDALAGPKQFKEFPGAGHEPCIVRFPAEWKATVAAFLSREASDQRNSSATPTYSVRK